MYCTLVQVGDCWIYALEANNKVFILVHISLFIIVVCRAGTVLRGTLVQV